MPDPENDPSLHRRELSLEPLTQQLRSHELGPGLVRMACGFNISWESSQILTQASERNATKIL